MKRNLGETFSSEDDKKKQRLDQPLERKPSSSNQGGRIDDHMALAFQEHDRQNTSINEETETLKSSVRRVINIGKEITEQFKEHKSLKEAAKGLPTDKQDLRAQLDNLITIAEYNRTYIQEGTIVLADLQMRTKKTSDSPFTKNLEESILEAKRTNSLIKDCAETIFKTQKGKETLPHYDTGDTIVAEVARKLSQTSTDQDLISTHANTEGHKHDIAHDIEIRKRIQSLNNMDTIEMRKNSFKQKHNEEAYRRAKAEIPEAEETYRRAKAEIPEAEEAYRRAKAEIPEAEEAYRRARAEIPEAEEAYRRAKAEIPERAPISEAEEAYRRAKAEIPEAAEAYKRAITEIPKVAEAYRRAKAEISEAKKAYGEATTEISEAKKAYTQTVKELEESEEEYYKYFDTYNLNVDNYSEDRKNLGNEIDNYNTELAKCKKFDDQCQEKNEKLNNAIHIYNELLHHNTINTQNKQYIEIGEWLRQKKENIQLMDDFIYRWNKKLQTQLTSLDEWEEGRERWDDFIELLDKNRDRSEKIYEEKITQHNSAKDILDEKTRSLDEKKRNLDEKTQNLDKKKRNLDEKTQNLDEKKRNLDEKTQNLDEKTRSLDEKTRNLYEKTRSLDEKKRNLDEKKRNLDKKEQNHRQAMFDHGHAKFKYNQAAQHIEKIKTILKQEFISLIKDKKHKKQINNAWSQVKKENTLEKIAAFQKTLQSCSEDIQGHNSYETAYKTALESLEAALEKLGQIVQGKNTEEKEKKAVMQELESTFTNLNKAFSSTDHNQTENSTSPQNNASSQSDSTSSQNDTSTQSHTYKSPLELLYPSLNQHQE